MSDMMLEIYEVDGTFLGSVQYYSSPQAQRHRQPYIEPDGFPCRDLYDYTGKYVGWIVETPSRCRVHSCDRIQQIADTREQLEGDLSVDKRIAYTTSYDFVLDSDGNFWKKVGHHRESGQLQKVGWLRWPKNFHPRPDGLSKVVGAALLMAPGILYPYKRSPLWYSIDYSYFRCKPKACAGCAMIKVPYKGTVYPIQV